MKLFELAEKMITAEGKGILNRGTQQHRVKTKYHRPSQEKIDYEEEPSTPLQIAIKKAKDIRYHKYTSEEEEALIKAGITTHTKKEAKKLARNGEYPVENFRAKPNMTVTIFYWPNKEIGKPYTVFH